MGKAGILSMQRIFNYGSFLQAYALKQILEDLGYDVEFVDYHPGECLIPTSTGHFRKFSKVFEIIKIGAPIKEKLRFIKYKKNFPINNFGYLGISEKMNYTPKLDLLVIGSDEVFNCIQHNANVGFSPELFGFGNKAQRLISYAASFGNTTLGKLEQYHIKGQISEWLNNFDAISVRDANSGEIVNKLTSKVPEYHFDPVLIYDFCARCTSIPSDVPESEYMILYGYSGRFSREECQSIRAYANFRKWKILCIGGIQHCCDKFVDCSPFQVIAYFQHASAIVTDTFHGTILSVITHQNFVSIVRNSNGNTYGNQQKLNDLLTRLGLSDHMTQAITDVKRILDIKCNFATVDNIITKQREIALDYLRRVIENSNKGMSNDE